jgi:protein ImuA
MCSVSRNSRLEIIQNLRERLHQLEQAHRPAQAPALALGSALDRLLPGKGWAAGTLLEWLGKGEGSGAATLALAVAAELLQQGGAFVVVDSQREFYPPAAASLGIPLERTVVVQPDGADGALWALEQVLRSPAVALAVCWVESLSDRVFRRLQLAAEAGGGLGFLLRPAACLPEPSWAEARVLVEASVAPRQSSGWRLRALVLHRRGGAAGEAVELELSHEASPVRLVPALARATLPPRSTGTP